MADPPPWSANLLPPPQRRSFLMSKKRVSSASAETVLATVHAVASAVFFRARRACSATKKCVQIHQMSPSNSHWRRLTIVPSNYLDAPGKHCAATCYKNPAPSHEAKCRQEHYQEIPRLFELSPHVRAPGNVTRTSTTSQWTNCPRNSAVVPRTGGFFEPHQIRNCHYKK